MRFLLPGQLRGPECSRVMQQAIVLRRNLEPWFASLEGGAFAELAIVLRIGGSLGSFGPEGVENIAIEDDKIECDVVVADHGWTELSDEEIASILRRRVFEAVSTCLATVGVPCDPEALAASAS